MGRAPMLERYLIRNVIGGTVLVLLMLTVISGFVTIITQVDDVGTGTYGIRESLVFAALKLPNQVYEMLPFSMLLGTLLGLGGLAVHSELDVMRASGFSVLRIASSAAMAGVLFAIVSILLGEFVGPNADRIAGQFRALKKLEQISFAGGDSSAWIKQGDMIVNVEQMLDTDRLGGVYLYRFDENRKLVSVGHADSAGIQDDGGWFLRNMRETQFEADRVSARQVGRARLEGSIDAAVLGFSMVDADNLSLRGLHSYARHLKDNDLDARFYEASLWSRVAGNMLIVVMTLLAVPFVLGPLRSSGTGSRMLVGILIGVAYVLLNKTLINSSSVFELNPIIIGWAPTVALALFSAIGIARIR